MKKQFKKVFMVFTLCFMILPISVYANESNEVEKDFTIEVSKDEVVKDNSFSIDVVEDHKDSKNKETNPKENNGITKEEMKELLDSYSKNGISSISTPQSKARATTIENVGADNKEYPIRRNISSTSTNTKTENKSSTTNTKERPSSDARQFLTFKTKRGKVFHLIIDHDKSSDNVQLLTEVSELDLLNMIETKEVKKETPKQEVKKEEPKKEVNKEPKKQSGLGSYFILGLVLLGALGAGYYFKIVKPKQEENFDDEEDENDETDDEFFEESKEEVKDEEENN